MLPKHCELWLPGLIASRRRRQEPKRPVHVYFCLADHYEPAWRGAAAGVQRERVAAWLKEYPRCAGRHSDSEGRHPQHSFFFPAEEYAPEHLDALSALCRAGWGDVEIHLHHDHDTGPGLESKLLEFADVLHNRHGLLRRDAAGQIRYAFIHGNWALNNSRPDGRYCGVDDETSILLRTGCYADMTMPCGAHPAQSRQVNSIYYTMPRATPRAHDGGPRARVGALPPAGLLTIQGPLALNWRKRKWNLLPRLESGDVAWHTPPARDRVALWVDAGVHVEGAPEHIFMKVHTHGAQDRNVECLLHGGLERLWSWLEELCRNRGYALHYVTACELAMKARELEAVPMSLFGATGVGALR
jgi:hypothetical protein